MRNKYKWSVSISYLVAVLMNGVLMVSWWCLILLISGRYLGEGNLLLDNFDGLRQSATIAFRTSLRIDVQASKKNEDLCNRASVQKIQPVQSLNFLLALSSCFQGFWSIPTAVFWHMIIMNSLMKELNFCGGLRWLLVICIPLSFTSPRRLNLARFSRISIRIANLLTFWF